jgi:two-component system OmpR family sensor kinase
MSLRARLLVGMLVLVGLGAIVLDLVTSTALHSFLLSRADEQLITAQQSPTTREVANRLVEAAPENPVCNTFGPSSYYYGLYDQNGTFQNECAIPGDAPPVVSASQVRSVVANFVDNGSGSTTPFTVGARGSSLQYRVVITPISTGTGAVVIGEPLSDLTGTLHHLRIVEILATASILGLMALISVWLVRVGLKPLDDMAETAGAIAEGDLSKRVTNVDPRTEVGRLGLAFNRMLSQIEKAFGERKRSEEQLRESEQRLRRFVADAGHELRTPLTSVRGYSELYRQGGLTDPLELDKAMGRIEENSHRMGILVEDLLLLARLDRDRTLERREVDLAAIASDAVADARAVEPSRPIAFHAEEGVMVLGDEPRLRQVAGNLLTNARVHTPAGTPVRVTVTSSEGSAVLEVADDGPGMPEDVRERVFERFYRADPSRSRSQGGAGLGLSIVAAIVQAHGGRVGVESAPGQGATFRVEIPARRESPPVGRGQERPGELSGAAAGGSDGNDAPPGAPGTLPGPAEEAVPHRGASRAPPAGAGGWT